MGAVTRIAVCQTAGRPRAALTSGLLRPQLVHSRPGWCRIALVATTALLLGGDRVELDIQVGPGARLELFDVAGTVALNGQGLAASWEVRVRLAAGALLHLASQPLVVADGACVTRRLLLDLAAGAGALLRDTVVLGRHGQWGGWLRNSTSIHVGGDLVLLEDQVLDPSWRALPGLLGDLRVLDSITALGPPLQLSAPAGISQFRLINGAGELRRYLGRELADSPLHEDWYRLRSHEPTAGAGDYTSAER